MVRGALLAVLLVGISVSAAGGGGDTYTIHAGTEVHCRLSQTLSTRLNFQGESFTATVSEPLVVGGNDVIPVGSTLQGRILYLGRPGRIKGVGEMRLSADRVTFPDGRSVILNAVLESAYGAEGVRVVGEEGKVVGPTSRLKDLQETGTAMGAGGFIGTLIGGFHGAVIGGAIGGAAGLAEVLYRRGKDLTLPAGTQLNYQLTKPLEIYRETRRREALAGPQKSAFHDQGATGEQGLARE